MLGSFIHYMATFVSGFAVGFTAAWQLALVNLAIVPLIAIIGTIHTMTLAKLTSNSQVALAEAGNIAEQLDDWVLCRIYKKKGGGADKHDSLDCKATTPKGTTRSVTSPPPHLLPKQEIMPSSHHLHSNSNNKSS